MSAASRTVQSNPSVSRFTIAIGAAVTVAVVGLLLAFGQLGASKSQAAPAAGTAPVQFDHGWSSASTAAAAAPVQFDHGWSSASTAAAAAPVLHDHGSSSASTGSSFARHPVPKSPKATLSTGIPWRTGRAPGIPVSGRNGGGILFVGIPYPAPGKTHVGGSNGVRLAN